MLFVFCANVVELNVVKLNDMVNIANVNGSTKFINDDDDDVVVVVVLIINLK